MFVHELDDAATATCHAGHRVVGDDDRKASFFHEQFIEVAQHRATTCQNNAAFRDIGAQFGRCLFESLFDGPDNSLQWFLQGFENFIAVQSKAARYAF